MSAVITLEVNFVWKSFKVLGIDSAVAQEQDSEMNVWKMNLLGQVDFATAP